MAEKEVSQLDEELDAQEPVADEEPVQDAGVVNPDSIPFPTGGEVLSTRDDVDQNADDFTETTTGEEERVEVGPESDLYVAPEEDELDPDEDDDEK